MSLKWYLMPRMVALKSSTPVLEAARAIENNNIGAVVVQDDGRVVGMVTDRDLAVRVLGAGLDARTTPLAAVMTAPVTTLSPADSQSDAVQLMQQRNIRRIPLVEAGRLVGIVTLDDLLLDEAAPLEQLSAVVGAQIGAGGWATALRSSGTRRGAARAQATYGRMLNQLRANADLETSERAETALVTVLASLVRRLTPDEAKDLIAQLPSLLHARLRALLPGPDRHITRRTIEADLCERLGVDQTRAVQLLEVVGGTITQTVSPGQIEDVQGQLPEDMRGILSSPSPEAAEWLMSELIVSNRR
jgi:CBS domain-containing protein/uncharacterized protein (DUF2267 family)